MAFVTGFASKSLVEHLARGLGAVTAVCGIMLLAISGLGWFAIVSAGLLAALTLFLLRGCPMCWLVGLIETIASSARR